MKNLTPKAMRCEWGACPAVYELDDGRLLVVGAAYSEVDRDAWCAMMADGKIGDAESAIIIDRALLADVLATTTPAAT